MNLGVDSKKRKSKLYDTDYNFLLFIFLINKMKKLKNISFNFL